MPSGSAPFSSTIHRSHPINRINSSCEPPRLEYDDEKGQRKQGDAAANFLFERDDAHGDSVGGYCDYRIDKPFLLRRSHQLETLAVQLDRAIDQEVFGCAHGNSVFAV